MDKPKNIYIAGGFNNRRLIRKIMDVAEELGLVITVDWTAHKFSRGIFNTREAKIFAKKDYRGVETCDYFLLVDIANPGRGSFTELGMAYALGKTIFVAGFTPRLFYFLPGVKIVRSWEIALHMIAKGS